MKVIRNLHFILCFVLGYGSAQNVYDARQSVILQATVQENPPVIRLDWVLDTANGGYTIWRKAKEENFWRDSLAVLGSGSTTWSDSTVSPEKGYEYQVIKSLPAFPYGDGSANSGAGYIYAGIKIPPTHFSGICLIVVDDTYKNLLTAEINRLQDDLEADGWKPQVIFVNRKDSVSIVKSRIKSWAISNPADNQALFLLGRVPVPYSGEIAPDGHHSDHRGAWPCDGYYADLDGLWTDQTVNISSAASSRNYNKPGDGKFDQNVIPSSVRLQVGRVDFSNMSKFPESEEQLLRRYLDKDHAWRRGKISIEERGLVDNNFRDIEGLGQSGWMNFAPMFGLANVKDLPYHQTLSNQSYLWSYGCGGGGPESASDISSTSSFAKDSLLNIFTMMFGSYFGDWDYPNNFLRAAIASRTCLASTWGNRPVWFLHHMAMGAHIGYSTQMTMNNRGIYKPRYYGGYVSTALMGDPTIKMHVHRPVESLTASQDGLNIRLEWVDPAGSSGYFIYKKTANDSTYKLLNPIPVNGNNYIDACAEKGYVTYMVRSTSIKTSGSGSYSILSAGERVSINSEPTPFFAQSQIVHSDPARNNGSIKIFPKGGCTPYQYIWNTGQTTEEIKSLAPGTYCVTITDCMGCSIIHCATVDLSSSLELLPGMVHAILYPNPARDHFVLQLTFSELQDVHLYLTNLQGKKIDDRHESGKEINLKWNTQALSPGLYWLNIVSAKGHVTIPFIHFL